MNGYGIYNLTKVKYSASRPSVGLSKLTLIDTYFTKSTDWKYEQEWRMFARVENAAKKIQAAPFPIYLFDVPADCIVEVILGCRMKEQYREKIVDLVRRKKSLNHITIRQARICEKLYKLEFDDLLHTG